MENNTYKELKYFIVSWNNHFPYDRLFRKKYSIPFNSEQHRNLSQIDIYLDILEDKLIEKQFERLAKEKDLKEDYIKTGEFLVDLEEKMTEDDREDFFEKLMEGIKKSNNVDNNG